MSFFLRMSAVLIMILLSSCSQKKDFLAQEFAQCNIICQKHFDYCRQHCIDNCPNCSLKSTQNSLKKFIEYKNKQKIEGKKIMRELNSYRDPLQCLKVTCNCLADMMACKQSCRGVIRAKLKAEPHCV